MGLCTFLCILCVIFFFKQKTAYEMRISDWSSDVCSSDLFGHAQQHAAVAVSAAVVHRQCGGQYYEVEDVRRSIAAQHREHLHERAAAVGKIGRASCRERVCQYV